MLGWGWAISSQHVDATAQKGHFGALLNALPTFHAQTCHLKSRSIRPSFEIQHRFEVRKLRIITDWLCGSISRAKGIECFVSEPPAIIRVQSDIFCLHNRIEQLFAVQSDSIGVGWVILAKGEGARVCLQFHGKRQVVSKNEHPVGTAD